MADNGHLEGFSVGRRIAGGLKRPIHLRSEKPILPQNSIGSRNIFLRGEHHLEARQHASSTLFSSKHQLSQNFWQIIVCEALWGPSSRHLKTLSEDLSHCEATTKKQLKKPPTKTQQIEVNRCGVASVWHIYRFAVPHPIVGHPIIVSKWDGGIISGINAAMERAYQWLAGKLEAKRSLGRER